jgi:Photosynthetic reaction centre cytochrome C subunit
LKSQMLPLFLIFAGVFSGSAFVVAQNPTTSTPPPANPPQRRPPPKPVNLQVLPKDTSGEQVMQIMHQWEAQLGVECSYCHTRDAAASAQAGRPRYNFADDGKNEKKAARVMLTMTQDLNKKYIAQLPEMSDPVSCGTCHRGHSHPEAFVPAPEHHEDHDHHEGQPSADPQPK